MFIDTIHPSKQQENTSTNIGAVVGPIVGILLVICAAVFVFLLVRYSLKFYEMKSDTKPGYETRILRETKGY